MNLRTIAQLLAIPLLGSLAGAQTIADGGIVSAANFRPGIAPGAIVSIFGTKLAAVTAVADAAPLPTTLGTTRVLVNGQPVPLFYVSPTQINVQLPYETEPGSATLAVIVDGAPAGNAALNVQATAPAVLVTAAGRAVATNQDGALNGPFKPTLPNSLITAYMTGQGSVDVPVRTGDPSPSDRIARAKLPVTATIGGKAAEVVSAGLSPGSVGLFEVTIRVPAVSGDLPLVIRVGDAVSNPATINVGWKITVSPPEE